MVTGGAEGSAPARRARVNGITLLRSTLRSTDAPSRKARVAVSPPNRVCNCPVIRRLKPTRYHFPGCTDACPILPWQCHVSEQCLPRPGNKWQCVEGEPSRRGIPHPTIVARPAIGGLEAWHQLPHSRSPSARNL